MRNMVVFLFLTVMASSKSRDKGFDFEPIISNQIHLLRPQPGSNGGQVHGVSCLSWRFGVETNNVVGWKTVPKECEQYVGHYMLGSQYRKDSKVVTQEAILYAKSLNLSKSSLKNAWVFDVDETSLSNLPYYAAHGFGVRPYNATSFNEWVVTGEAPALPESLKLYKKLVSLGIEVIFLTGRTEDQRTVTETNLKTAGYRSWERVLLRGSGYVGKPAVAYKSAERKKIEDEGYKIVGNIGDQWSDLLGTNTGDRTFKLPDPMYYIS